MEEIKNRLNELFSKDAQVLKLMLEHSFYTDLLGEPKWTSNLDLISYLINKDETLTISRKESGEYFIS